MSLREFEHVLDKMEVGFLLYQQDREIEVQLRSPQYPKLLYTIWAQEEQNNHTAIFTLVPPMVKKVEKVDKLLAHIGKKQENLIVEFDEELQRVSVGAYLSPGCHEGEVGEFLKSLDLVYPLLLAVSVSGKWNIKFANMIMAPAETLPQA